MSRRTVLAWCTYDFGNSAFAVLYPTLYAVYYRREIVGPGGEADLWWGWTGSLAMLLVALAAPVLGGIADFAGVRKRMLASLTILGLGATLAFGLLEPGWALAGCLLGALADFGFEGGIVFYNAYLPEVAPPGKQGAVSGLGFAVGYAGSLVALGVGALLAAGGDWSLIWVALAAQWGLAAVVSLRGLPSDRPVAAGVGAAARAGIARTVGALRRLKHEPALRTFLLAAFFYLNGVHTVIWFAAVYADATLGFTRAEVLGLVGVVQATALVGSLAAAGLTDRRGPRTTVRFLILWWVGAAIAAGLAADKTAFWIVGGLAGLGLGGIQAASRVLMARLVPPGQEAESFALYALCGRTGAVAGPLVFGVVAFLAGSQRPAVVSVAAFLLVGWIFLGRLGSPALTRTPTSRP